MHSTWSQGIKTRTQQQIQCGKHANSQKPNNTLLNDQCVIDEIIEEINSFLEANENENKT
jgi:hypothetical protein